MDTNAIIIYQWQRCSAPGTCVNIPGDTASTHNITGGDATRTIRIKVTADGVNAYSDETAAVSDTVEMTVNAYRCLEVTSTSAFSCLASGQQNSFGFLTSDRIYLKFNNLPAKGVGIISSAALKMTVNGSFNGSASYSAQQVLNNDLIVENGLQPALSSPLVSGIVLPAGIGEKTFSDLSAVANGWYNDGNYGLSMRANSGTGTNLWFATGNTGPNLRPKFTITFSPGS